MLNPRSPKLACPGCGEDVLPAMTRCRSCGFALKPGVEAKIAASGTPQTAKAQDSAEFSAPAVRKPPTNSVGIEGMLDSLPVATTVESRSLVNSGAASVARRQGAVAAPSARPGSVANPATRPPGAASPVESSAGRPAAVVAAGQNAPAASSSAAAPPVPVKTAAPALDRPSGPGLPQPVLVCECGRKFRPPKGRGGKMVKCPGCGKPVQVPVDQNSSAVLESGLHGDVRQFHKLADAIRKLPPPSDLELKFPKLGRLKFKRLLALAQGEGREKPTRDERIEALQAIGESGDRRAVEPLLTLARDNDEPMKVREAAAVVVGVLGDRCVLAELVELLDGSEAELRAAAVTAMGALGDRRAVLPLIHYGIEHPHSKYLTYDAILRIGDKCVLELLDVLNAREPGVVLEAVVLLGRLKDARAIPVLVQVIETRSALFRAHAAEALGLIGDRKCLNTLLPLLKDENVGVRTNAAAALGKMPDAHAVEPLVGALADEDADVRLHAIQTLGEIGDARAATALCRILTSGSVDHQLAAADALGQCGDTRAVPLLLERIQSDDEMIQLRAISALRRLKDPRAIEALTGLLHHASDAIRQRAVDTLGRIGDAEVAARLEEVMKRDRSELVRVAAAKSLGDIGDPGSIDALLDALDDEFPVKCRAIVSLGAIGDETALPAIVSLLKNPAPEVRFHAVGALAEIGPANSIEMLEPLIEDSNGMVRRGLAKAFEKLGDPRAESLASDSGGRALKTSLKRARAQWADVLVSLVPASLANVLLPGSAKTAIIAASLAGVLLIGTVVVFAWSSGGGSDGVVLKRGKVKSVALSGDGSQLAVARTHGLMEYWNPQSEKLQSSVSQPTSSPLIWVPGTSTHLAVDGQTIHLLDPAKGSTPVKSLAGHAGAVSAMSLTANGSWLATLDSQSVVIRWKLPAGEQAGAIQLPTGTKNLVFALTADGSQLVTADQKSDILIWDLEKASLARSIPRQGRPIFASALSPDGSLLAISSTSGVELLPMASATMPPAGIELPAPPSQMKFSSDGKLLASLLGSTIFVTNVEAGSTQPLEAGDADGLNTFSFSGDGKLIAAGGEENSAVWVFDVSSGKLTSTLDVSQ